jgi:hypothetical protein
VIELSTIKRMAADARLWGRVVEAQSPLYYWAGEAGGGGGGGGVGGGGGEVWGGREARVRREGVKGAGVVSGCKLFPMPCSSASLCT